jgi:hypothetical protein
MKTLVISAAALSLTGLSAFASESDWSSLDQEVELLNASVAAQDGNGPTMSGYVTALWQNSSDFQTAGDDTSGFGVPNARLYVTGSNTGYAYAIEYNAASNTLLDAHVTTQIGGINLRVGAFKQPILQSSLRNDHNLFFVDRSVLGQHFNGRDAGAMLFGNFDALGWWLSISNGVDGLAKEYNITARAAFNFMGGGNDENGVAGAFGGTNEMTGTVGAAVFDDGSSSNSTAFAVDAAIGTGTYWITGEVASLDDNQVFNPSLQSQGVITPVTGALQADSTPWAIAGTYMISPDTWEAGVRYQSLDDTADTNKLDVAVNHYNNGHDVKWTIQFTNMSSDNNALDGNAIVAGVEVGF